MTLKIGKLFIGASLALSLGGFAMPVGASIAPSSAPSTPNTIGIEAPILVQYAEEEEHHELKYKAERKADEVEDEARAANSAVKMRHRAHEAAEPYHDGVVDKTESKMDEMKDSARDAKDAVKAEHRAHEAAEGDR
jgi:hypothetical protein